MSNRDASVTLDWADGQYTFSLKWGQLIELQEKLDAGPSYILEQFHTGNWRIQYIWEIIRLGLIGGGTSPADALKLVRNYIETRPPLENLSLAQALLTIGLVGATDEQMGEARAAPTPKSELILSPEGSSESQTSTEPVPQ